MHKDYLITLLETKNISRKTVQKVITTIKYEVTSLDELRDSLEETKQKYPRIYVPTIEELKEANMKALNIEERCEKLGIEIISFYDKDYPQKLKEIVDPPVILYLRGNIRALNTKNTAAVIGTREPSEFGYKMAMRFGSVFAQNKITVVSGLAIGCDTGGHMGCLKAEGITIAVLANGLDTIYPSKNKQLAEQIINCNGCIISEYPPGKKVSPSFFVDRDRIQAGLSDAVVVVETDIKGGTMHTVGYANKEGRILATLKHPEKCTSNKSRGNQKLINDNLAMKIENSQDLTILLEQIKCRTCDNSKCFNEQLTLQE